MERLSEHTVPGLSANALRRWGFFFLAAGLLGRGLIQTHLLQFHTLNMEAMFAQMGQSRQVMTLATISLVLQAAETCAAPIFAMLLVDRVRSHNQGLALLGRLTVLALVCEVPYNAAMNASLWDAQSRNPVFALVLSLVMLLFYGRFQGRGLQNAAIKLGITLAALVWGRMLRIDHGAPMALITATLWLLRGRPLYRGFAGAAASVACMAFSPFYLAAPMGFLAVHNYNPEQEDEAGISTWIVYPCLLAATAGLGMLISGLL